MSAIISDENLNHIKSVLTYPLEDEIHLADTQITQYCVTPAIDKYFIKFPIKAVTSQSIGTTETEIDFPDTSTFGVLDMKIVGKSSLGTTSSFWDLLYYNSNVGTRHGGMYGIKNFNPNGLRQSMYLQRQAESSFSNLGTVNFRVDITNRVAYAYTTAPGNVEVTWAKKSDDFSNVRFEYKWDVIHLAQAYLLKHLADTASILEMSGSNITINYGELKSRASELEEEVMNKWNEIPSVIVIRGN